ncbi:MAG: glycosyltransferase family 4 protein [Candidatus Aenigmarchaeota archaeon]|nr:glycosyltransferase family 4 protein [Candidatus Aenigmarchaeota archaeon]
MRIAVFCWEYYPRLVGGLGTYAIEITKKIEELGHEIVVFTLNDGTLKTLEKWNGIEVHRPLIVDITRTFPLFIREDLKKWGTGLKFFSDVFCYNYLSVTKFLNLLIRKEKRKFDLVAFHDWLSAFAGIITEDNRPDVPTVFHIHSVEEQRALGGGSEVIKEVERTASQKADKIITVSHSLKEYLISLGYPSEKITVCWNGCDPEKYNPKNVNEELVENLRRKYGAEGKKVILFVGRLTYIKGVQQLLQSLPLVLKEFPDVKLVILGKGEEYGELITMSQKLDVFDEVIIKSEWVPEEERIAHYALADVCVFPSLSEPFGIVSLEAMSMEKPVVVGASGISGLKEQVIAVGENRTGLHVDGRKPDDIAWGIKEVLKNPKEAKRWGENGRKRVLEFFTWDIATKNTLKVYEELVER